MSKAPNPTTAKPQRVLVVGLGTMGMSHARAYQAIDGFERVGKRLSQNTCAPAASASSAIGA